MSTIEKAEATSAVPVNSIPHPSVQTPTNQSISTPILATSAKPLEPSAVVTPTPSTKKSRKSDNHQTTASNASNNSSENNFLPIAPQSFFQSPNHQGLTLASVQQQLQPGSVALFTSPTMAMVAGAGPQATVQQQGTPPGGQMQHSQQQLVVTPGQAMAPQFSGPFQPNGQTHQLIQTSAGMGMMSGLSQVQVIGTNGQSFGFAPQFYTTGPQPMLLNMLPNNASQSLAIQLPNVSNTNGTMIATSPMGQSPSTPVKNQTHQQTTIVKGVTISPQQQTQQAKTNANNINNKSGQQGPNPSTPTQQIIPATSQTLFIQSNGSIMPSTSTNARKSTGQGRSSGGNKGTNLIQKIQPATSQLLTPQFKTNTTFTGNPNANSASGNPTIMVHGQGIQPGPGGIQLNQSAIISNLGPFQTIQPSIWASPTLNQPQTQLVAPNGQILIRTQGPNDSPHMLIQTSNNPFQTVQMPMPPGAQQTNQTAGQMQVTQTGQPIMASSINQPMPISIQTNQTVSSPSMGSQQTTGTANMLTVVSSSANSSTLTSSTTVSTTPRQRPLRPASGQQQPSSSTSTQTTPGKSKAGEQNRTPQAGNVPKLAPKSGGAGGPSPAAPGTNLPKVQPNAPVMAKLPLPAAPKLNENGTITSTPISTTGGNATNKMCGAKVSTATQSVTSSSAIVGTTSVTTTTPGLLGMNSNNLVTGGASSAPKFDTSFQKLNRKTEKKDAASSTDNKNSPMLSASVNGKMKPGNTSSMRNPNVKMNGPSMPLNGNFLMTNNNQQVKNNNVSGPPLSSIGVHTKTLTNGVLTKSNCSNTPSQVKSTQNDPQVLTHVIDGFVIQESPNPFPINGFLSLNEFENNQNGEDTKETDNKEKGQETRHTENDNQPPSQAQTRNDLCANCRKNERMLNAKKKKWKKYCQVCVDQLIKKQQTFSNVGSTTMGTNAPTMGTIVSNPVMVNGGGGGLVNMHGNRPQQTTANGRIDILKRPFNATGNSDAAGQTDSKKQRLSSGTAKTVNGGQLTNNVNGTGEAKAENSSNNLSDKMWLPAGGTKEPSKWTVQDVYDFMSHLDGCAEMAEGFKTQEIDGQALMLIKEDHIIDILNTKLGPALKICRKIKELKEEFNY